MHILINYILLSVNRSAFHEAIGDAIALSVQTPRHLQTLGLVQKSVDDTPHDINYLFALAMDKVS